MRILLMLACLFLALPLRAQQPGQAVPAPDVPPPVKSGEVLEPDITIIAGTRETVHEYRLNGVLYMIKVVPKAGPPYYLIDTDGDGDLESQSNGLDSGVLVPMWMILRW